MAKVWMAKEGSPTNTGGPWREIALSDYQEKLGLIADNFKNDPANPPRFGDIADSLAPFRDPTRVIVELENAEAVANGWGAGFYILDLSPQEAQKRLR